MQRFIGERFVGTSAETKPTIDIISGSIFDEIDTTKEYIFKNNTWVQKAGSNIVEVSGVLNDTINATGNYLYSLISSSSAGVISVNGISGAITVNGAGNVSVTSVGQTITVSGNTGAYVNFASTGTVALISGNLITTGQTIFTAINSLSGQINNKVNTLSGYLDNNFARITTTNAISGNLIQSGINLRTEIHNTGQQAWTAANNNGINLSGNLFATGSNLSSRLYQTGDFLWNAILNNSGIFNNLTQNIVYTTGNQTINGIKTFSTGIIEPNTKTLNSSFTINALTNNTYEFASLNMNGSVGLWITVTVEVASFVTSKQYIISAHYNHTNNIWVKLLPISNSGPFIGNDCELEGLISNNNLRLRIRRTGGAVSNADVFVSIKEDGPSNLSSVTYTTITGVSGSLTSYFPTTFLTQESNTAKFYGNTQTLGNSLISGNLSVNGNTILTGQFRLDSNQDAEINYISPYNAIGDRSAIDLISNTLNPSDEDAGSVDWNNRTLIDSTDTTSLDWQNKILVGPWTASELTNVVYTVGNQIIQGTKNFSNFVTSGQAYITGSLAIRGNTTATGNVFITGGLSTRGPITNTGTIENYGNGTFYSSGTFTNISDPLKVVIGRGVNTTMDNVTPSLEIFRTGNNVNFRGHSPNSTFLNLIFNDSDNAPSSNCNVGIGEFILDGPTLGRPSGRLHIRNKNSSMNGFYLDSGPNTTFLTINPGGTSNNAYIQWFRQNGVRLAYLGHGGTGDLNLTLENNASLNINGGNTIIQENLTVGTNASPIAPLYVYDNDTSLYQVNADNGNSSRTLIYQNPATGTGCFVSAAFLVNTAGGASMAELAAIGKSSNNTDFALQLRGGGSYFSSQYWTSAGSVGFGTDNPSAFQHGGSNRTVQIHNSVNSQNSQSHIVLSSAYTGVSSSYGTISWAGTNLSGTNKGLAYIAFVTNATHTTGYPAGTINFGLRKEGESNWSQRMSINSSGQLNLDVGGWYSSGGVNLTQIFYPYSLNPSGYVRSSDLGNVYVTTTGGNQIISGNKVFTNNISGETVTLGETRTTYSTYYAENQAFRNPTYSPSLYLSYNNAIIGHTGMKPGLILSNTHGASGTTSPGILFTSQENTIGLSSNQVALGGIYAIKQQSGVSLGWTRGGLQFFTKNQGNKIDSLFLNYNGNVGILTQEPTRELDVNGSITANGYFSGITNISELFYPKNGNPSGYVRNVDLNNVYVTTTGGNQIISGLKHFAQGVTFGSAVGFAGNITVTGSVICQSSSASSFAAINHPSSTGPRDLIDLNTLILSDLVNDTPSLDWSNRILVDTSEITNLNWNQRHLYNEWKTTNLVVSGQVGFTGVSIVTGDRHIYTNPWTITGIIGKQAGDSNGFTAVMGQPSGWLSVKVNGIERRIPYY